MNREDRLINELDSIKRRISTGKATPADKRRKVQITDELQELRGGPHATDRRVPHGIETR